MASFPRSVSLAVFRAHIENGLSVAIGVGLTGVCIGWALGFDAAMAAASGAVCVSITDRTDPLRQKAWIMGFAFLGTVFFTGSVGFRAFLHAGLHRRHRLHRPVDRTDLGLWQMGAEPGDDQRAGLRLCHGPDTSPRRRTPPTI